MADVRIKINRQAARELLRSPEVLDDLDRRARRIAAAAGPGHEVISRVGRRRARSTVITTDPAAMAREASGRALTRAIDAGRS